MFNPKLKTMATDEEKIEKTEKILKDLLKVKHLMSEKELTEKIDYYLDYLIPLYKERKKKK